jgi:hypothetical protein
VSYYTKDGKRTSYTSVGKRVYIFEPVGWDRFDAKPHQPNEGDRVVKVQPYGCPKNGAMGHTYVADAETLEFRGLVHLNSLRATSGTTNHKSEVR